MKIHDKANWIAIFLHFICGAIVTGLTVFYIDTELLSFISTSEIKAILTYLLLSMNGGSMYATYQNEIWLKHHSGIIPPISAKHSIISLRVLWAISLLTGLGAVIVVFII